jgi:hypothetical protein
MAPRLALLPVTLGISLDHPGRVYRHVVPKGSQSERENHTVGDSGQ